MYTRVVYHEDAQAMEQYAILDDGVRDGEYTMYDGKGRLILSRTYVAGVIVWQQRYRYENDLQIAY